MKLDLRSRLGITSEYGELVALADQVREVDANVVTTAIYAAQGGRVGELLSLYNRLIATDAHLSAAVLRRTAPVESGEIRVEPVGDADPGTAAELTATLHGIAGWSDAVAWLERGRVTGLTGCELVWSGRRLDALEQIPTAAWETRGHEIGLRRADGRWAPIPKAKVVMVGAGKQRLLWEGLRPVLVAWLIKTHALREWALACSRHGLPPRYATLPKGVDVDSPLADQLLQMLAEVGARGSFVVPDGVDVDHLGVSTNGVGPHQALVEAANREMSKAVMGQTLTLDTTSVTGTLAAARVHESGLLLIGAMDARAVGAALTRDVLDPLLRYQLQRPQDVGRYRVTIGLQMLYTTADEDRSRGEGRRADAEALAALVNVGIPVTPRMAYDRLGLEPPEVAGLDAPVLGGTTTARRGGHADLYAAAGGHGVMSEGQLATLHAADAAAEQGAEIAAHLVEAAAALVDAGVRDPRALETRLRLLYPNTPPDDLAETVEAAMMAGVINAAVDEQVADDVARDAGPPDDGGEWPATSAGGDSGAA